MKKTEKIQTVRRLLLGWFQRNKRDLPWRENRDPYRILVSEFMLQQTQVDRVVPKFRTFLRLFPTVQALAHAQRRSVVRAWAGLGYNNRAVRLHEAARAIVLRHKGVVPQTTDELERLPGVGSYTARAIGAFAFDHDVAALDVNYDRVVSRVFFGIRTPTRASLASTARKLVPQGKSYTWNHSVMDFGALVCRSTPRCDICPLRTACRAYPTILRQPTGRKRQSKEPFTGSNRFFRGKIVAALRAVPRSGEPAADLLAHLRELAPLPARRFHSLLASLAQDGVVEFVGAGRAERLRLR